MKKILERSLGLGFLALCVVLGARHAAQSRPLVESTVQSVATNDGDSSASVNVACGSGTWWSLLPARPYRRRAILSNLATGNLVCLSTVAVGGCLPSTGDVTAGIISSSQTVERFSQIQLYCKGIAGTASTTTIYGCDLYDSGN